MEEVLREIGLTENEIKLYIALLKGGNATAYELGKKTGIYRVHVYDKMEQLMAKGLVTHIYKGAKKFFTASSPDHLKQFVKERREEIERQEERIEQILPELHALRLLPKEDTRVELFKGKEGLKYFLKDIIKTRQDVCITGIDDEEYHRRVPHIMSQYFRDLRHHNIHERVITTKKEGVFLFDEEIAATTEYRYLKQTQFNPTNTFIYGDKVVIVAWGTPITVIMIKNSHVAETNRNHFEHLWSLATKTVKSAGKNE